jgi:hypothetical protein
VTQRVFAAGGAHAGRTGFWRASTFCRCAFLLLVSFLPLTAQYASITGTVSDPQQARVPNVSVILTNVDMGVAVHANTDMQGDYEFAFVRPGNYSIRVEHPGFQPFQQSPIKLDVDQRVRVNVALALGENTSAVIVEAQAIGVQTESSTLGTVVGTRNILEVPLNGRFILDVALLSPGTVVPSTNNRTFLAVPSGVGSSGINASGTREDSTNYLLDGINLSDMAQNQITLQPNIDMVQEFKVQQNSFSAEYGRNAGIVVNAVTRPGSNSVHGSVYEFLRNERFDAKNFFDPPGPIIPFNRNIFGYSVGAPAIRNRTFFFTSYEGRVGLEVASIKTLVPGDAQRATVTNPIIRQLLGLVPTANDPAGTFFIGSAPRDRRQDQWSGRVDHSWSPRDLVYGSLIINRDNRVEPTLQGNNLQGFGDERPAQRYFLSLGFTRIFSSNLTNELRAGFNRLRISFHEAFTEEPSTFDITSPSTVFPNITVPGALSFGGISGEPQGRGDTTYQYNDTVGWSRGKHSIRVGGEFRRFANNNLNSGTGGMLTFGTLAAFLAGTPTQAIQTSAPATPSLHVNAFGAFVQDDYKVAVRVTLNLGLRWEYNGVPWEKHDRLSTYDFASNALVRVGVNGAQPYRQQFTNFGPRVGFAYDPFGRGKTVVRGALGIYYDQPTTNIVQGLGSNPPFSAAVNNTSNINLANPFAAPPTGGSAISAIDPNFRDAMVLSYNFNVQHEAAGIVFQAAYVGSEGHHLRIFGDWNQGVNGLRPIPGFSSINIQQSVSNSNYNGVWLSANRRLTHNLTFNTSYTFSKSIDNNSVGSSNPQAQDFHDLRAERALSDFDARNRFVLSAIYQLPFHGQGVFLRRLAQAWSVSPIVNLQSGNPFSPIIQVTDTRGSLEAFDRPLLVSGVPLALPDPSPNQWINPAAFVRQATGFGDAGRNILTGPGFADVDLSIAKDTKIRERLSLQFRSEAFNLFNHPNFGQPQNNLAVATFGQITATRTTRGDLGSSRQIQFALKLLF